MYSITYNLPESLHTVVHNRISSWQKTKTIERLWSKDPFVWKANSLEHKELADRLGWLSLPEEMLSMVDELNTIANTVKQKFSKVILLGMGGSSLAPEVFSTVYGNKDGYPSLSIIDSTHPQVVQKILNSIDLDKTIFVMASKSGGTAETNAFYFTFFDALEQKGLSAGAHFIALTDPGTYLDKLAREKSFAYVVATPPEVGGRYSALTPFGMLPAALMGIDVKRFLENALLMQKNCSSQIDDQNNPGLFLGALLGELALQNINKITFITSEDVALFPQWVEQLVAESTGKEGKGILPIADEPIATIDHYGKDRAFIFLTVAGKQTAEKAAFKDKVVQAGFPTIQIELENTYDLAGEFYRWEMATAVASIVLEINPFDQPDVQLAKTLAGESLKAYKENGSLPEDTVQFAEGEIQFSGDVTGNATAEILAHFLKTQKEGDYLCLQGFIPYDKDTDKAIAELRKVVLEKYHLCSTFGYGPRFLHSTGQLHKGGQNDGLFIQITDTITDDLMVSSQGYSFGTLITAQSQGDAKALLSRGRRYLKLNITGNIADNIRVISKAI